MTNLLLFVSINLSIDLFANMMTNHSLVNRIISLSDKSYLLRLLCMVPEELNIIIEDIDY